MKACFHRKTLCHASGTAMVVIGSWLILSLIPASAQTNRTWNGSVNDDWFNPTNWIPVGVPAANDIVNFTSGTISFSTPVTLNGQFNWSGGTLGGSSLTIATNGVMTISGTSTLFLENALTNAGTVLMTNTSGLNISYYTPLNYFGLVENLPGALWNIENDQTISAYYPGPAYFHNAGTFLKSGQSGTTAFALPFINDGTVRAARGTLNFSGGGNLAGAFTASNGASILFSSGGFTNSVPPTVSGPGTVEMTGGNLLLLGDSIPNLILGNGNLILGPAFQGGTITNLTISGATLISTNTVSGSFNWNGGTLAGPLTIATNGVMTISGTSTLFLENTLTNAGTVLMTNTGGLNISYYTPLNYFGLVENLPGALWNIENDQTISPYYPGPAYFHNAGTLLKSGQSGTTVFALPFNNDSTVTAARGTLSFSGGGNLAGAFTASNGATILFSGGSFTNTVPPAINGSGTVQLSGGSLTLLGDSIPNLGLGSGNLILGPGFQGGTITNLTLSGATLASTNTVTGSFNWVAGVLADPLMIATNGLLTMSGTATHYLQNSLTNAGTVIMTNSGRLVISYDSPFYFGLVENLPGALWNIENDQAIAPNYLGPAYIHNAGTFIKSGQTGATSIGVLFNNDSVVVALQGTLDFGGGGDLGGAFTASNGASILFSAGGFTNAVPPAVNGPGTVQLTGGNLTLLGDAIPNLGLDSGNLILGPGFQGGTITNLTLSGATLASTNTVTGSFNWVAGVLADPLLIATNGVLNISGSATHYLQNTLTNAGTVEMTNSGGLIVSYESAVYEYGLVENLPGALWNVQNDQTIANNLIGPAYFHNAGTFQKSGQTGATTCSIAFTNSGTVSLLSGTLALDGNYDLTSGTVLSGLSGMTSYGTLAIAGNAVLGGTIEVVWLNGYVPTYGNSFTLVTYGSFTGGFTNVVLPPAATWNVAYGATALSVAIAGINQLAFTTEPAGGVPPGESMPAVMVQVENQGGNPLATNNVPVTVSLGSGTGNLNGTLTRMTDPTGKATFGDLSVSLAGTKSLGAAAPGLTPAVSSTFVIVPLFGVQPTNSGVWLELNGTNSLGPTVIYASSNLLSWLPIYTNPATSGPILYLDTSVSNFSNFPRRFYRSAVH